MTATERPYSALRLAGTPAKRQGVELRVFLMDDAVAGAVAGQKIPEGHYHLDRRGASAQLCGEPLMPIAVSPGYRVGRGGGTCPSMRRPARSTSIPPGTWTIDPARSRVGFSVRHMMIATVRGRFTAFEGSLASDAAGLTRAAGVVQTASIDTSEPNRDAHLRGASFLDAERSPQIWFTSRRIERGGGGRFRVVGDLTIKGVTRELVLQAVLRNESADPDGLHVGAHGEIMRSDFGLSWTEVLEAAGALVSDRVRVSVEVLAVPAAGSEPDRPVARPEARGEGAPFGTRPHGTSFHERSSVRPWRDRR